MKKNIVGIDLGTSHSAIARLDSSLRPEIIPNGEGEQTTPSVLLFEDNCIIIGREARRMAVAEPERVLLHLKREMGNPRFAWTWKKRTFNVQTLSAMILKKLKLDAEEKIGPIHAAVIAVPAYFDDGRRKATEDAGHIAGLEVLDVFNEPSAAALAYGMGLNSPDETALVFDLGGGTFDVTVVHIQGENIRVVATDGDMMLGGLDWDLRLVHHVADKFDKTHGLKIRDHAEAYQDLLIRAEEAKITLSRRDHTKIVCQHAAKAMHVELTRDFFEGLTEDLLVKTQVTTELVLESAGISWKDVDRLLLVGGGTRMPMVRNMLRTISGMVPDVSLPADLVVAQGAAIWAGVKSGMFPQDPSRTPRIQNVNSHSLGVEARNPKSDTLMNTIIIPKNSPLPCKSSRTLYTKKHNQMKFKIDVLEGESSDPEACIRVGTCRITSLPPNLPKRSPIEIVYEYDGSGRIRVTARELKSGGEAHAEIVRTSDMQPDHVEAEMRYLEGIRLE
jgi:molecular chaperone DnaK